MKPALFIDSVKPNPADKIYSAVIDGPRNIYYCGGLAITNKRKTKARLVAEKYKRLQVNGKA